MRRLTIQDMQAVAKYREGECLSTVYVNEKTHLRWRCKKKHEWEAAGGNVKSGQWCPYCARNIRLTIKDMQDFARSRGGECISTEYKNLFSKLMWRCEKGHTWNAIPSNVIHHNKWCPYCAKNAKFTIDDVRNIIEGRGLILLSTEYKNMHSKLRLQCPKGHEWEARLHDIKDDYTGCPECSSYKMERLCRKIFEIMFNSKFPKIRPDWLRSSNGSSRRFNLELDGYNENLKLAFEYQGHQHFKYIKIWHKKRTLEMQKERDREKKKLCQKNNVILIEIPWTVKVEKLEQYIRDQCKSNNIVPTSNDKIDYTQIDIYKDMPARKTSKEYQMERKTRDPEWFRRKKRESDQRYLAKHRERLKAYHKIKYWQRKGQPITTRDERNEKYLKEIKQIAKSRGGFCISKVYVTAKTKLEFECKEGHRWFATPHHMKAGSWCTKCYRISLSKKKDGKN